MEIKLLITDFDGTLVDTFQANYEAYRDAFGQVGLSLTEEQYRQCYGLRFDDFMRAMAVEDEATRSSIRSLKSECYPAHFDKLRVNRPLLDFIRAFRQSGGTTAIASTARRKNLLNALNHIEAADDFDLILAGEDVSQGKPSPEIYNIVMSRIGLGPEQTLIFEDSSVGLKAAEASGAHYVKVTIK